MYTLNEKIERLQACPLFAGVPFGALRMLALTSNETRCPAGEVLFVEGEEEREAYVILEGEAQAFHVLADGRKVALARFGPSDIVGEFAVLAKVARTATVEATVDLKALRIDPEGFLEVIRAYPDVAVEITRLLVERLLATRKRFLRAAEIHPDLLENEDG